MNANNKKRILSLIEILKKETDMEHKLSLNQIAAKLESQGISIQNRKTLYDDFKALNESGFVVEYDKGYYLMEAPFSLSEIKIITDSLNSLKNLDDKFLEKLIKKLYSFLSTYEENLLKQLEYRSKHSDKKFINRLEDTLQAIKSNKTLKIKRSNKEIEEICPIFLHRNNNFYYLYYHYLSSSNIYHTRFDNIVSMSLTDNDNDISISKKVIKDKIDESTNSFYSKSSETIKFKIINDSDYLRNRLADDFPNVFISKDGFIVKASVNDQFFSKLTSYGDDIKISDTKIANQYIKYLEKIIIRNKAKD